MDIAAARTVKKNPKYAVVVCVLCELFPVHVGSIQVVIDSPKFTGDAPERFM